MDKSQVKTWPSFPAHKSKVVKIRQDRWCFFYMQKLPEILESGKVIKKGSEMLAVKIMPNSATGQLWEIETPFTLYACGECETCKSKWAQDPDSDEDDYPRESKL